MTSEQLKWEAVQNAFIDGHLPFSGHDKVTNALGGLSIT